MIHRITTSRAYAAHAPRVHDETRAFRIGVLGLALCAAIPMSAPSHGVAPSRAAEQSDLPALHSPFQEPSMSATAVRASDATRDASVGTVDMKLEVVTIPVSDVDRAKAFYEELGWRLDADFSAGGERVVQFTPTGSACSIHFGSHLTSAAPGSLRNLFLVVPDIQAAREELVRRGVVVGEVFHYAEGPAPFGGQVAGLAPGRLSYGSYASFEDPDGNGWLLQEVTTRLPGRVDPRWGTTFTSVNDLASALRRASAAHNEHEKRIGEVDAEGWPDWYAAYMVAEQSGAELPG